jgi:8-oxo-dGTP pyrophosphatase MutT (NUDIX family)
MEDLRNQLVKALLPLDFPRDQIPLGGYGHATSAATVVPRYNAAVLIPIIARDDGPVVLFTQRSDALSAHASQVSFPGGRIESHDSDGIAAALRETHEEVGINPKYVQPLGLLDFYDTISDFRIMPVVGLVAASANIEPDLREVAAVFEVSLNSLRDLSRYRKHSVRYQGQRHQYYSYQHGAFNIWGATAQMMRNLVKKLTD